jgi:hypothetical protein
VRGIKIANQKVSLVPWPAVTSLGFSPLLISRAQPLFLSFVTVSGVQAYTVFFFSPIKLWSLILKTGKTCNKRLKKDNSVITHAVQRLGYRGSTPDCDKINFALFQSSTVSRIHPG